MAALNPDGVVRAAGGVVWRPAADGPETCLVHRPRYDDWSLPKGKLTPGEHPLAAAVREVAEETEIRAVPQARLSTTGYRARNGAPKTVDYWLMRVRDQGAFEPNHEVDEIRWVPLARAGELVNYPHDARVLGEAAALLPVTAVVLLVRHTYAGERSEWPWRDEGRPLETTGVRQAHELADLLAVFGPRRLVAARPDRCRQTLAPLAASADLPIEVDGAFDEGASTEAATTQLRSLAAEGREPVVVCSQGKLIPRAMAALSADLGEPDSPETYVTAKGSGWLLAFAGGRLVAQDQVRPGAVA